MLSLQKVPDTNVLLSVVASLVVSVMLFRNIKTVNLIPFGSRCCISSNLCSLSYCFSSQLTLVIEKYREVYFEGYWATEYLFWSAETYLGNKLSPSVKKIKASKNENHKKLEIFIDGDEEIYDVFEDVEIRWKPVYKENIEFQHVTKESTVKSYELTFHKKHKAKVLNSYLPYILQQAEAIKEENKLRKIHLFCCSYWRTSIRFDHPMTFDTIAMDLESKQAVLDDLNTFMNAKEYYRRIGKAWKRGYVIHGLPGTGKSSLIAAIANHLNYNIHDLDLSDYRHNYEIRSLLHHYLDRTVLVIKDIDSNINEGKSEAEPGNEVQKQELLLKLLKHIDGLWLPHRRELIIVATTSHIERLDPVLLTRIDIQVHMPSCSISTLKQLVYNYFLIDLNYPEELEELLEKTKVTPAEVVRQLTMSTDPDVFLESLIKFLDKKELENMNVELHET